MWAWTKWWVLFFTIQVASEAMDLFHRDLAAGSGHWQMCLVFSSSWPQRGHLLWGHCRRVFIIFPVAQWLVMNLACQRLRPSGCSLWATWAAFQLTSSKVWSSWKCFLVFCQ